MCMSILCNLFLTSITNETTKKAEAESSNEQNSATSPFSVHISCYLLKVLLSPNKKKLLVRHNNSGSRLSICFVCIQDGRGPSGVLVCAMFCFCHLFSHPVPAMQLLSAKRPGSGLWPSHHRFGFMS
ncbi:hypothetical protein GOODEAATRI_015388, partial [Goodea atripinnis]